MEDVKKTVVPAVKKGIIAGAKKLSLEELKAKALKVTELVFESFEEDQTSDATQMIVVHLAERRREQSPDRVINGQPVVTTDNKVYIVGEDVTKFLDGVYETPDGKFAYSGSLKFDVSAPKVQVTPGGGAQIVAPGKIWLRSTSLRNSGIAIQRTRATSGAEAMAEYFKKLQEGATAESLVVKPEADAKLNVTT